MLFHIVEVAMKVAQTAVLLTAGTLLLSGQAWGIDGSEVIRRLQERFADMKSLSARFERKHYWKLADQTRETRGRLYVQKPDRFRFETPVQTVVTDGKTAWNYSSVNEQVLMSSYKTVRDDRSYEKLLFDLILLGGYSDRFVPRYVGEVRVDRKTCHLVELIARQEESHIPYIRLWVDRKVWLVRQVEYRNINDDVTTHMLSDLKVDKNIREETFTFQPPEGVEVVDLR